MGSFGFLLARVRARNRETLWRHERYCWKSEGVPENRVPGQLREASEEHATPSERRPLRRLGLLHAQLRRSHGGLELAQAPKKKERKLQEVSAYIHVNHYNL